MRATIGRHNKPSNGLPYTRIMAAFMLATLISTLFALPASANPGVITNLGSAPKVLPGAVYSYTVVYNNDSTADTNVVVTGTLVNANAGVVSFVQSTAPATVVPCVVALTYVCTAPAMAAAETMTITVNVTATGAAGTSATNAISVVTTNVAGPTAGPTATTPIENADLAITKTHTGTTTPGGTPTYTISIHNNGPSDASAVQLADTAPVNVTFGAVTVASLTPVGIATCNPAPTSTSVACLFPTIVAGQTVNITVPSTLGPGATAGTSIANTASLTSGTLDSAAGNNSSTDTFVVGAASVDLAVALTVLPTTAAPGDTVTYTATVTNPDVATDATNVVVADTLPVGLTPVSPPTTPATGNGTAAVAGNTWTWTIPTVAKATAPATPTTVTASFDATVDQTVDPTTTPTITNTVNITGATQTDPAPANNTASADLTISASAADLHLTTTVSDSKPNQGDTIHIAIMVANAGPANATNVQVKDVLPTGLKYVSCSHCSSGLRRQTSKAITFASIANGQSGSVVLNVLVQASSGTLQNTASITSVDQTDPTPGDISDSQVITIGSAANNPGGPTGSTGGTGGTGGTTGGTTAFTGFTAGQLLPWFMLLFSLGLVAVEWSRRMRLVSPIGSTYGFEPPF